MWTTGMLTLYEMWCGVATACGLDKKDPGRRRFRGLASTCQGVLQTSLSPLFSVLSWLTSLLVSAFAQSRSHSVTVSLSTSCLFYFLTHIRVICLGSCPGFNNGESKSSLVWRRGLSALLHFETPPKWIPKTLISFEDNRTSWSIRLNTFHSYRIEGLRGFIVRARCEQGFICYLVTHGIELLYITIN